MRMAQLSQHRLVYVRAVCDQPVDPVLTPGVAFSSNVGGAVSALDDDTADPQTGLALEEATRPSMPGGCSSSRRTSPLRCRAGRARHRRDLELELDGFMAPRLRWVRRRVDPAYRGRESSGLERRNRGRAPSAGLEAVRDRAGSALPERPMQRTSTTAPDERMPRSILCTRLEDVVRFGA